MNTLRKYFYFIQSFLVKQFKWNNNSNERFQLSIVFLLKYKISAWSSQNQQLKLLLSTNRSLKIDSHGFMKKIKLAVNYNCINFFKSLIHTPCAKFTYTIWWIQHWTQIKKKNKKKHQNLKLRPKYLQRIKSTWFNKIIIFARKQFPS